MLERERKYWANIGRAMEEKHRDAKPKSLSEALDILDDLDAFSQKMPKYGIEHPPSVDHFYQRARELGKIR